MKIKKLIDKFQEKENFLIKSNIKRETKTGKYGHLDLVDEKGIHGWFVNLDNPDDNELTVKINGIEVGKVKPSFQREDINSVLMKKLNTGFLIKWEALNLPKDILNKENWKIELYFDNYMIEKPLEIKKVNFIKKEDKNIKEDVNQSNFDSMETLSVKGFIDNAITFEDKTIVMGWCIHTDSQDVFLEDDEGNEFSFDSEFVFRYTRNDIIPLLDGYTEVNPETGFLCILPSKTKNLTLKYGMTTLSKKEVEYFSQTFKEMLGILFSIIHNTPDFIDFAKFIRENILEEYLKKRKQSLENLNVNVYEYGEQIENPEVSIIIPIYKRFDFVEHQILEFIKDNYIKEKAEIIYILDDPGIKEAFETEIGLLYKMFRFPIKWIDGQVNRGFSGANNLGAKHTKGEHILFLNSDCIPKKEGWLKEMVELLKNNEEIGIVGCRLLYPDGSIQHAGMEFKYLKEWDVYLNHHPYLGLDPILDPSKDITEYPAVTGACMLMRKTDFEAVGGWDGLYLIGDFEDSDLCLKVNTILNKKIIYTPLVELTHLERQSYRYFSDDTTKLRITLYNAKRHYDKWKEVLDLKGTEF